MYFNFQLIFSADLIELKVSKSRKKILVSSILPKNELENLNFHPSPLGQKVLFLFWKN